MTRIEWATRVAYPPGPGRTGEVLWLAASTEATADTRVSWHTRNGAAEAVKLRRVWTPGDWEVVA